MADFYYRMGESVVGPLTGIELREAAFAGSLGTDTLVATSHEGPWVPARRVKGLYGQDGRPLPHPPDALRILERANVLAVNLLPPPPLADDVDEPPQPEPQAVPPPLPTPPFQLTPPQQPAHQTSTPQPAPRNFRKARTRRKFDLSRLSWPMRAIAILTVIWALLEAAVSVAYLWMAVRIVAAGVQVPIVMLFGAWLFWTLVITLPYAIVAFVLFVVEQVRRKSR